MREWQAAPTGGNRSMVPVSPLHELGSFDVIRDDLVPAAGVADTLVVAVPKFSSTGIAVLVDIDTLSCRSIQFL